MSFITVLLVTSFALNIYQFIRLSRIGLSIEALEGQVACVQEHINKVEERIVLRNIQAKTNAPPSRRPNLYKVEES